MTAHIDNSHLNREYLNAPEPDLTQRTIGALADDKSSEAVDFLARIALTTPEPVVWDQAMLALDSMAEHNTDAERARNHLVQEWGFEVPYDTPYQPRTSYLDGEEQIDLALASTQANPRRGMSIGAYFGKVATSLGVGAYLGAVIGVIGLVVLAIGLLLIELFSRGLMSAIVVLVVIGILLYFGGIVVAYIAAIVSGVIGGIVGGVSGLLTGLVCGVIYILVDKDEAGNVHGFPKFGMGVIGVLVFGALGLYVNDMFWLQWRDVEWLGWINIVALAGVGYFAGSMNGEDLESITGDEKEDGNDDEEDDGFSLMAPFRLFGGVANGLYNIGDASANTVANATSSKTTIRQDGKTHRRRWDGEWSTDKNWLGQEKVERDVWGRPKIERDFLGRQKIERDLSGRPIIPPEHS